MGRMASALDKVLEFYQSAFSAKVFTSTDPERDLLMDVFGLTPEQKADNRQYWGRELGMCWQRLCAAMCSEYCKADYAPPVRVGADEPYDFSVGTRAIDTKYRVGSGDAGTLKKFKGNGEALAAQGMIPTMLILREDNLQAAIGACRAGGWDVRMGAAAFDLLKELTGGFDLAGWLSDRQGKFLLVPGAASLD
jgi:hypothetical protein